MKRAVAVLVLLGLAIAVPPARGSEESQALGARALVEADAGRTSEAMELLDRAVDADPGDPGVRYQRGALRATLGAYADAIVDLKAALAERPYFPQASLELGAALIETERPRDAVPRLKEAQSEPDLDAQASFLLGIAQLRLGELSDAVQSFERARSGDPSLERSVEYNLGVVAYRRHDLGAAEAIFAAVEQADPESALGRESARFLELIRGAQSRAYEVWGSLGLEYDSNVTLASSTTIPGTISEKGDGRFVINAGGAYVPWQEGPFKLAVSYQFLQTLHFDLTQYNLQDHRPAVQLTAQRGTVTFGLLGRYDYYLLDTDSYLQEPTASPWISIREPGIDGRTDLYYRMQWRDFKKLNFDVLNGYYHFTGIRQIIDLGVHGQQLWVGYEYGFVKPVNGGSDQFKFNSQQADVGVRWPLPFEVTGETGYRFEYQHYAAASRDFKPTAASRDFEPTGARRKDHDHRVIASLERPITEYLVATVAYFGTFNNSNQDAFQYDRHIASIGARVSF